MSDTRQRILDVALDLFAERGYVGASMADIAGRLGTTKAALYYHFSAKGEILEALLAEPLAGFIALAASAPGKPPVELLGEIAEVTAELYAVSRLLGDDPSVRTALRDREMPRTQEVNEALTRALGGGSLTARAHASFAAIKNGTLAVMASTGARPTEAERTELVAAALRALDPDHRG